MMDYEFLDTYYELMTCFMNPVSTNLRISCNKVTLLFFKRLQNVFISLMVLYILAFLDEF